MPDDNIIPIDPALAFCALVLVVAVLFFCVSLARIAADALWVRARRLWRRLQQSEGRTRVRF